MPVHEWMRVEARVFHDFHTAWVTELRNALNAGLLPRNYYALAEQHAGHFVPDLLTLHAAPPAPEPTSGPGESGGLALAEAPPRVRRREELGANGTLRRTLAVRHVTGHRLVAVLEINSPANKYRAESVEEFSDKILSFLDAGVHVLVVDLWPPGPHDPQGVHGVLRGLRGDKAPYDLPADEPLTLASYETSGRPVAYVEHLAFGRPLPDMPLFFRRGRYINVPLETTYQAAYRGVPAFWREVLERACEPGA